MNKQRTSRTIKPILDALLIVMAFGLAYYLRYEKQWFREVELAYRVPFSVYLPSLLGLTVVTVLSLWIEGAYRYKRDRPLTGEIVTAGRASLIGITLTIFVVFLAYPGYYSRLIFGYAGVLMVLFLSIGRAIERIITIWQHRRGKGVTRVLFVGAGELARSLLRTICARPELGYAVVGLLDDDPTRSQTDIGRFQALGTTDLLEGLLAEGDVGEVIITLPWSAHSKTVRMIELCNHYEVLVRVVPDLYQMSLSRVAMDTLNGIPLITLKQPSLREWQSVLKRIMDVAMSVLVLGISLPIMLLTALAIRLDSPGPIFFRQQRVGQDGELFDLIKFRSMYEDAEQRVQELKDQNEASGPLFKMRNDPRRTRVGAFIRRVSIDELPQFWNVLKGEMSVVGPRPALPSEVAMYEPWHLQRLEIAPGITGLWQVSGRSDLTFDEMVLLDVYYIENWSLATDLVILAKTIPTVLMGSGAY